MQCVEHSEGALAVKNEMFEQELKIHRPLAWVPGNSSVVSPGLPGHLCGLRGYSPYSWSPVGVSPGNSSVSSHKGRGVEAAVCAVLAARSVFGELSKQPLSFFVWST